MAILVTGGAGFIGTNFILDWLSTSDETVINLDKLTYAGNIANFENIKDDSRYVFINADINNRLLVRELLHKYNIRAIIHFAAESHVDRSIINPESFIQTNIVGTFSLLDSALAYWQQLSHELKANFRFVHISTDEVYGSLSPDSPAFTELHRYEPNSPYSASKAASDHLVRAYCYTYGLPVLTTNCSNNYGPYQYPEKLIPFCIKNALQGKALTVYGDGLQIRDWLYVKDHCSAIRTVLASGVLGEVYNIGGGNEKTNIEVIRAICSTLDLLIPRRDGRSYKEQISYVKDRAGHDRRYAINATKIMSTLNWRPEISVDDGLYKTIKWYIDNSDWFADVQKKACAVLA